LDQQAQPDRRDQPAQQDQPDHKAQQDPMASMEMSDLKALKG
jgi:hypothetical protein